MSNARKGWLITKGKGRGGFGKWGHFKQVGHFRNPVFKTRSCFEMPGLKQWERSAPPEQKQKQKEKKRKKRLYFWWIQIRKSIWINKEILGHIFINKKYFVTIIIFFQDTSGANPQIFCPYSAPTPNKGVLSLTHIPRMLFSANSFFIALDNLIIYREEKKLSREFFAPWFL